jgi:3'-5' exoribonuclease
MKQFYAGKLEVNEEITDFFMVKSAAVRTGSNGKDYLDLGLGDCSGEINGKKWDVSPDELPALTALKEGDIVKIKGLVTEWNSVKQLRVQRIRKAVPTDELVLSDYVKAAPEDPEEMFAYVLERAGAIKDEGLRKIAVDALEENKDRLLYYPGAMRNHHAELGGLLYHIRRMLTMGLKACQVYTGLDKDWVVCGVIMHDMEKLNELRSNEFGISPGYTAQGNLLGHIVMGAAALKERAEKVGLDEEKTMMLQHMIVSHHYEPEFGSPVRPMFPEAELLHYLDMIDAKMFDFEAALEGVEPGGFSERVRTLDGRMLYNPTFERLNTEKNKNK